MTYEKLSKIINDDHDSSSVSIRRCPKKVGEAWGNGASIQFSILPHSPTFPHFFGAPSSAAGFALFLILMKKHKTFFKHEIHCDNGLCFRTTRWFSNYLQLSKILRFFRAHSISCIQLKLLQNQNSSMTKSSGILPNPVF